MASDQQFCLRWNNHQQTLLAVFDSLLENQTLVDCTLAAEGRSLQAHKVVLSACSPYFAMLLREHNDKFPILILKDIKYQELQAMMNYMYRGEVNITQETLGSFLKAAESLQIRGLTDSSNNGSTHSGAPSSGAGAGGSINCIDGSNNNGVPVRDPSASLQQPYHTKKMIPDSRKLVAPVTPLISSQQRSRSPVMLSQPGKKYPKSSTVLENYHTSNNSKSSTESAVVSDAASSAKRRKLLPPIKSEGLVVTPINPAASLSTYNNLDINSTCDVPSQAQTIPAHEGRANVPSPSVPPKVESPHMDITPVVGGGNASRAPSTAGSTTSITPEPVIKMKSSAEFVKVKKEEPEDSYNEDTNDDSYTTEDNCDNDESMHHMSSSPFQNSQSGTNFDNLPDRTQASHDGNNSLQDASDACAAADEIVSKFVIKLSDSMPIDYCLSTSASSSEQSHQVAQSTRFRGATAAITTRTVTTMSRSISPAPFPLPSVPSQHVQFPLSSSSSSSSSCSSTKVCFPCDSCGNVYSYKTSLARHVRFECGKDPQFQCPFCEHRTKHKSSLTTHIDCKHRQELAFDENRFWREIYPATKTLQ